MLTGVVAAVVSAPISAFVYGNAGANAGRAAVAGAFQAYGSSLLGAATWQGFVSDPLDKTVTSTIVVLIMAALPIRFRQRFPFVRQFNVFGRPTHAVIPVDLASNEVTTTEPTESASDTDEDGVSTGPLSVGGDRRWH